MTKFKLVPIEPTQEMIDEGRTARTHPRERYKAMLAAAPDVQGEPVVWLRFRSHRVAADDAIEGLEICEPGEIGDDGGPAFPVYAAPQSVEQQPAPDAAILVEALESIAEYWNQDSNEGAMLDACEYAQSAAQLALAAYHKQGGDL